jgi:hypothetical protein
MPTKKSHRTYRHTHPRCKFQFADGRRCRMLRDPRQPLCLFHHRELLQLQSAEEIGAELLSLGGNFQDPIALNFVLGKLFAHVATGRMHRRQASTLAYIAQLLLQTLDTRRYNLARDRHDYRALIPALNSLYDPAPIANRSAAPAVVAPPFSSPRGTKGAASSSGVPSSKSDRRSSSSPTAESQTTHPEEFPQTPECLADQFLTAITNAHTPPEPTARL